MKFGNCTMGLAGLVVGVAALMNGVAYADELRMSQVAAANPCAMQSAAKNPCATNPCAHGMNPCNPCAAKNPGGMAMNPCGGKNPCGMSMNPCNPCGAKNPCATAMNPCNPCAARFSASDVTRPVGSKRYRDTRANLVSAGRELWNDPRLSTNGLTCNNCHMNNQAFLSSFLNQYPHEVAMAKGMGIHAIQVDEMVQLCMVNPMANEPLPWDSRELAALAAYSVDVAQQNYIAAKSANPCNPHSSMANPCNPCATGMNPCNPCMANPCARH
jgi:hypothetical protein